MIIDVNCDLGEGVTVDGQAVENRIMPLVSSANIACGRHAGNKESMKMCIGLAIAHDVSIGAHPSYDDRENFGRAFVPMQKTDLIKLISEQIATLGDLAALQGKKLNHVKAHGALYNAAVKDADIADALARAVAGYDKKLVLFGLPKSALEKAARQYGLAFAAEAFPDRSYNDDGSLTDRRLPGAVLTDPKIVLKRAVMMVKDKRIQSVSGKWIGIHADTLCIHGDNPKAYHFLMALKDAFQKENITVKPTKNVCL